MYKLLDIEKVLSHSYLILRSPKYNKKLNKLVHYIVPFYSSSPVSKLENSKQSSIKN